ncbi:hypothetical protein [Actinopolymorpha sp. B9G3]|uniref:hypothetical protein n=1 Tax=Actinopolymorpha sp. B9G3 TaxID=3158970 RepID=UPI0032D91E7B
MAKFEDLRSPQTVSTSPGGQRATREDFEQLRSSASAVHECAVDFERSFQRLLPTLRQRNPWGADEPGTIFGMAYTALLGKATQVLGSHVGLLQAGASGLATWSKNAEQTEAGNAERLNAVGDELER